ncbi:MAG: peptidase M15 [Gammaproteobacteria bacterium]|nr:peptidase M15 [Gammaproteobacteria bacterium]
MIDRRTFIAAGAGLVTTLFASGHARRRVMPPAANSGGLATARLPSSGAPVPLMRGRYAPPITDFHPDSMPLDQIASEPAAPVTPPDVILNPAQRIVFGGALARLRRLQSYVGHGNFNIIGWDQSLKFARARDSIGAFTRGELGLIEEMFSTDAKTLGFYGDKVVTSLSASIARRDIVKIPTSGHFLFKGASTETFNRIRRDLGDSVVLTSGIRSVVKQVYLFMNKAERVDGNLSLASFSLAPPGHSYHAVGDFDVGKKGFGRKNFSEAFAQTDEFKRLIDLGYLDIRYPQQNPFGVRYEPWHIKVA